MFGSSFLPVRFTALADVRSALGESIGPSPARMITQPMVDDFARITEDFEWLHVDVARAAEGPYGTTIAHGYLTLSLVAGFAAQLFRFEFGDATVNYGIDRVRFPSPLLVGTNVRAMAAFNSIESHAAGQKIRVEYRLLVEGAAVPVCVAEALLLVQGVAIDHD